MPLAQAERMKRVVGVVLVVSLALTGVIVWQIRAQRAAVEGPATGSGVIEGEGVNLSARMSARVVEVVATEGEPIEEGGVVLVLDCTEPEARLSEMRARLEATRAQTLVARAQAEAADRQSQAAHASVGAAGAQSAALGEQRDNAAREAQRLESMGTHSPGARRDQAESAARGLEAQVRAARASRAASARQAAAASAQAQAAASAIAAAEASVAAMEAALRAAEVAVSECRIVAPKAAIVERIYFEVGELVGPGAVVARIVDPSFVRAMFYLPNADVDAAALGAEARVEADAFPGRTFIGEIYRIGLEAEFTPRNIQTRTDRDRLVFPVEVRIPNDEGRLRAGMPVTVTLGDAR